jgi:oligosaccharide repeat unit polymerase
MGIRYYYLANDRDIQRNLSDSFVFVRAFCVWFRAEGLADRELLWGFRTFWKAYEYLGVQEHPESSIFVEESSSNIFTAFRGLLEDFGPLGSCLVMFVLGFVGSIGYRNVVAGRASSLPVLIFVFAYGLLSTSFSLFTYNAPNVAMALFCVYFLMRTVFLTADRRRVAANTRLRLPKGAVSQG